MMVVSLTTIALACVLGYFRFEETYTSLAVQRLQLTAQEVARVLQAGLDLRAARGIPGNHSRRVAPSNLSTTEMSLRLPSAIAMAGSCFMTAFRRAMAGT